METTCKAAQAAGAMPLLGHILPLLRDPLRFWASLPRHGDLVTIRVGPMRAVVVCTAELTREVLVNDKVFDKGGPRYTVARTVIGDGLAACPHSMHRRQRRLLQPTFHPQRLPGYARVMAQKAKAVTDSWR